MQIEWEVERCANLQKSAHIYAISPIIWIFDLNVNKIDLFDHIYIESNINNLRRYLLFILKISILGSFYRHIIFFFFW